MAFTIGTDFDRAIPWAARLDKELPFLRAWLRSWNAGHVLDAGCGTGRHSLALAGCGFHVTGTDIDPAMLTEAVRLAEESPPTAGSCRFLAGDLRFPAPGSPFDAALCVGNSLCLLPTVDEVRQALAALRDSLAPRGGLLLHVLNYLRFRDPASSFFPLKTDLVEGKAVRHFQKMIQLDGDGAWVHMIRIEEGEDGRWTRQVRSDRLLVLDAPRLRSLLLQAGFGEIQAYGSLQGGGFQADSHDLVLCARRS
jgi:SAM-dependent methyltransferase